jgi:hypothetical protein
MAFCNLFLDGNSNADQWAIIDQFELRSCKINVKWLLHSHWIYLSSRDVRLTRAVRSQPFIRNYGRPKCQHSSRNEAVNQNTPNENPPFHFCSPLAIAARTAACGDSTGSHSIGAMKRSAAGIFCISESAFHVTAVALAFRHARFRFCAAIGGEGPAYVDLLLELAFLVSPNIAFVPLVGLNHRALARL